MEQIFEKLQADVLRAVQQIYSEAQFSLIRKPAYWWHVFEQVMVVGMIVFFLLSLIVLLWPLQIDLPFLAIYPNKLRNFLLVVIAFFVSLSIVIILPALLIDCVKSAKIRVRLRQICLISLYPSGFGTAQWFINSLFFEQLDIMRLVISWIVLSNTISLSITTIIVWLSSLRSYIFFFVLDWPVNRERETFVPSFDQIVFRVIEQVKDRISDLRLDQINYLQGMAQRKQASLGVQSQTVASIVATFSLFGLVALLFTQEEVRALLGLAEQMLGDEFRGLMIGIATLFLLGIAIFPLYYFFRILVTLRVLDIVIELLEMRIRELQARAVADGEFVLHNGIYVPQRWQRQKG